MADSPLLLVLLAAAAVVAVVVLVRRRGPGGRLATVFQSLAARRDWNRVPVAEASETLATFPKYLDGEGTVDLAVGASDGDGAVLVAAVGVRETVARGRPWYVATVSRPDLSTPEISFVPRSVRTVRVVAGEDEVVIDDPRISRGWRISSTDPRAAEVLDHPPRRDRLSDALHRPMPFIVGLQTRPGAIAVHLAGPEDEPTDADDLDRLARLALEVADALATRA